MELEGENEIKLPKWYCCDCWGDRKAKAKNRVKKRGIPNYGNTCYLNSVLQILASTPNFSRLLKSDWKNSKILLPIIKMINKEKSENFMPKIANLLEFIYQANSNFTMGRQNDSKELFAIIIDKFAGNNEEVKNLFSIRKEQTFQCESGHVVQMEELNPFLVVPSDLDKNISRFIENEEKAITFYGENQVYCDTCQDLRDTDLKTVYIFPNVLALYFESRNLKDRKIERLEKFKGQDYEIYGVICFYPVNRHYVAFTLNNGIWFEYNDEAVHKKEPDYEYTYMAFYRKSK